MTDRLHISTIPRPVDAGVVLIVDDDPGLRDALSSLFRSVGLQARPYGSAADLLQASLPTSAACLVLDIRMPGVSGLDLQAELAKANIGIPVIFLTGHGDIPMTVKAMKSGAVDFLTKPFRDQDLLDAVSHALDRDRKRRSEQSFASDLQALYTTLTPREQQIMSLVASGLMNKQVARQVGVSEITVKVHRGRAMRKMGANSLADLVRMVDLLGLSAGGKGERYTSV
jgi:FixJ family two-component response regulator